MEEAHFSEKRKFPRFHVNIPLSYLHPTQNKLIPARTYDISAEGLCIITDEELPMGIVLDICLNAPDNEEKIILKGKTIWTDASRYEGGIAIGLKLENQKLKPIPLVLRTIACQRNY